MPKRQRIRALQVAAALPARHFTFERLDFAKAPDEALLHGGRQHRKHVVGDHRGAESQQRRAGVPQGAHLTLPLADSRWVGGDLAGIPLMVTYVGWARGLLFVLSLMAVGKVAGEPGWPLRRIAAALIASLVPFRPFVLDARLRREERERPPESTAEVRL
jgi:integral membrane protein